MDANEAARRAWELRVNLARVAVSILRNGTDAEDAVATAMMLACQRIGSLRKEERFNAWMMSILVRCSYDILRKRGREVPTEDPGLYDRPVLDGTDGTVFEAIQTLPDAYRKVLVLHYFEGFKAAEVSRILSLPLGTVLVQLSRGREKLKQNLLQEKAVHHEKQTV